MKDYKLFFQIEFTRQIEMLFSPKNVFPTIKHRREGDFEDNSSKELLNYTRQANHSMSIGLNIVPCILCSISPLN